MRTAGLKLYVMFIAGFLVMHFTGVWVSGLPYILGAAITSIAVLATLILFVMSRDRSSLKDSLLRLGLSRVDLRGLLPGIIVATVLLLSYPVIEYVLHAETFLEKQWYLNVVGLFLTGGITEEVLFRGFFFGGLRRRMSFRRAVAVSATWFALTHLLLFAYMDWQVALLSTLLALASAAPLAFLFEFGNATVWSPAVMHTAIRTIGLVVTTSDNYFGRFSLLWILGSILLPYVVLLSYRDFRNIWSTKAGSMTPSPLEIESNFQHNK